MNNPPPPRLRQDQVPEQVPVLTDAIPDAHLPPGLGVVWDARMAEKQALLDLAQELTDQLRPELDRLTSDLVARTLEGIWVKRCETYQSPGH